jgi:cytochrome P460
MGPPTNPVRFSLCALLATTLLSVSALNSAESVRYPDDFRRWVHVGTGVIMPGTSPQLESEEGMHHVFANPKAVGGYASGNFADGSILVYELRDAKATNGIIAEGDRKRVDVMIKDARHAATGGWTFERFRGDDRTQDVLSGSGATACFQCHSNASAHGFVFSQLH